MVRDEEGSITWTCITWRGGQLPLTVSTPHRAGTLNSVAVFAGRAEASRTKHSNSSQVLCDMNFFSWKRYLRSFWNQQFQKYYNVLRSKPYYIQVDQMEWKEIQKYILLQFLNFTPSIEYVISHMDADEIMNRTGYFFLTKLNQHNRSRLVHIKWIVE